MIKDKTSFWKNGDYFISFPNKLNIWNFKNVVRSDNVITIPRIIRFQLIFLLINIFKLVARVLDLIKMLTYYIGYLVKDIIEIPSILFLNLRWLYIVFFKCERTKPKRKE